MQFGENNIIILKKNLFNVCLKEYSVNVLHLKKPACFGLNVSKVRDKEYSGKNIRR